MKNLLVVQGPRIRDLFDIVRIRSRSDRPSSAVASTRNCGNSFGSLGFEDLGFRTAACGTHTANIAPLTFLTYCLGECRVPEKSFRDDHD